MPASPPQTPPPGDNPVFSGTLESGATAGAAIGPYHLLELIGTGGMGEVWLAEQKHPIRRRVALKLIKPGMDTREIVARFGSEQQALALMDHPTIAKVFDAGSTPQGRPYFVMEYVPAIPITIYCDKHKLTTRERLELFIQACDGVQHAHQKAIIHRDLKPTNILVTEVDGKPVPKIIDFGVAKAISQRLTAETMFTSAGAILGTPEYMSPEQADSGGDDIDTRTDVYSLGVVLYELLVGALPLDLRKLSFDEMLRRLREEDTPRPSTKVRTLGEQSVTSAQNRRTEVTTLSRQLRGDLDAITLKALEKERPRRYGSPSELATDIGRYLRNEPVVARPASLGYRARKYIRRHRLAVAVATGLLLLLACFAIVQGMQLRRITRERDRADRITDFMTSMFKVSNPSEARGNKVTAREILDRASNDIDTGLANDPELQAQMMHVMGTVYFQLALYSRAHALLTRAVEIRRDVLGPDNPDTLRSINNLANTFYAEGQYREAEKRHRLVFDSVRRRLGLEHPETIMALSDLAVDLMSDHRYAEAEKLNREVLDIRRRILGPDHRDTTNSMDNLAEVLDGEGRYAEAEKLQRQVVDVQRRVLGPDHPDTLKSVNNLAATLAFMGQYSEAEKLIGDTLPRLRQVLGPDHPDTAMATYNLACLAAHTGQNEKSLALLRQAVDHGLGPDLLFGVDIDKDPDLNSLHSDPRFQALVAYAHQRAGASKTK